jgi:hypothetical protein
MQNQGNCGSCYAFTAAALVESQVALTYGSNYTRNLSPQQVVDCDTSNAGWCVPTLVLLSFPRIYLALFRIQYWYLFGEW